MKGRRSVWWASAAAALAAGGVAWLAGQGGWAAVLVAVGVLLPVAGYLADRRDARSGDLDLMLVADQLASAARKFWADEAKRREITSPALSVSWQPASNSLVQSWSHLQQLISEGIGWERPRATATGPQDLAGSGPQILTTYDRTPCGRLVVLGEPGAGKTVLLIRLVLDLLKRRQPGEPVPLLVPLASWNPDRQSLTDWLEGQILRQYPHLTEAVSAGGRSRARALLDAGRILPVLDGLDEIRAGSRAQALVKINDELVGHIGFVLSSRVKAFRHAVRPRPGVSPIRLEGSAGIRLDLLTPLVVVDYLIATAGEDGLSRWAQVRSAAARAHTPLARTLTTPLVASLARAVYNPRGGDSILSLPDPTDLTTLTTSFAIEQHILAGFIRAQYKPYIDRPNYWNHDQADRYLIFLARHLEYNLRTTSLAWWELDRAVPRIFSSAISVLSGPLPKRTPIAIIGRRPRFSDFRRWSVFVPAFAIGLTFLNNAFRASGGPSRIGFLAAVLGGALALSPILGLKAVEISEIAANPRTALIRDRTGTLVVGTIYALSMATGPGIIAWYSFGPAGAVVTGSLAGAFMLISHAIGSTWFQLGVFRLWLAARRNTPLRLILFLEDAHDRGVLRQAGAVWEFRHANLQRYLANLP